MKEAKEEALHFGLRQTGDEDNENVCSPHAIWRKSNQRVGMAISID